MEILTDSYFGNKANPMVKFDAEIVLEYSSTPNPTPLGKASNKMHFIEDSPCIIWEISYADGDEDEQVIGLEIEGNTVTGYDGVMSIPEQAVKMLQMLGYNTDEIE